jgi:hypothetical protein
MVAKPGSAEDEAARGRPGEAASAAVNLVPTLYAEAAGSAILACLLVSAGILAERFGGGNIALATLIAGCRRHRG